MEIEITKEDKTYLVHVIPKKMKRMILRYKEGAFYLSVPQYISGQEIYQWLNQLEAKQFEALKKNFKVKQTDDFIYLFGKKYIVVHRPMKISRIVLKEDTLVIYDDQKNKALERFIQKQLEDYIAVRLNNFYQLGYIDFIPSFKVQKLRSKYGACFYQKQTIKFALMLVHETKEVIDSIIVHELGHFYYPNHSTAFYAWVKKHDPNFDTTEKILKNGGSGDDSINEQ